MKVSAESTVVAKVLKRLPTRLSCEVGKVVVAYSNLEHQFTAIIATILQLHKPEARLVLQSPPVFESLDTVQDLLALKALYTDLDFVTLRAELKELNALRNSIAHGIWLRHPTTKQVYLRLTRGQWKKRQAFDPPVRRVVFPESIPMGPKECAKITKRIDAAIRTVNLLGRAVDRMRETSPDRFRQRAPLVDPLARRTPPKPPTPRGASRPK